MAEETTETEATPTDDEDLTAIIGEQFDAGEQQETTETTETAEAATEETTTEETAEETTATEETAEETTETTEETPIEPHPHWTAEHQTAFRALPREQQAFIRDRYNEMEGNFTRRRQALTPYEQLDRDYGHYARQNGATVAHLAGQMMNVERALRTGTPQQQIAVLSELAQAYGVNFDHDADTEYVDPQVHALQQEVAQLRGEFANGQQAAYQEELAGIDAEIDRFAQAKDANGNPAHPYFDEVYEDMIRLAQARPGQPLSQLYETAIWSNPAVRAKVLATQNHEAEQARKKAEADKVAAAKRGSVSVSGAGTTQAQATTDDLDDPAFWEDVAPSSQWART